MEKVFSTMCFRRIYYAEIVMCFSSPPNSLLFLAPHFSCILPTHASTFFQLIFVHTPVKST